MENTSLLASLRQHTASLHRTVEQQSPMRLLMLADVDDDRYLDALYWLHNFVAWAEPSLRHHFSVATTGSYYYYPRLSTLIRDIHQLNGITPAPMMTTTEPCFFRAVGMAYVIEGSTAGGQLLARRLQHKLARDKDSGLSYFNFHRRGTWSLFKCWLQTLRASDEQKLRCTDGAKDCFASLLTEATLKDRC